MAIIKCPECGKEVSDRARSCPNCGTPIDTRVYCPACGSANVAPITSREKNIQRFLWGKAFVRETLNNDYKCLDCRNKFKASRG